MSGSRMYTHIGLVACSILTGECSKEKKWSVWMETLAKIPCLQFVARYVYMGFNIVEVNRLGLESSIRSVGCRFCDTSSTGLVALFNMAETDKHLSLA